MRDLRRDLGDYLEGGRLDGVFHLEVSGPGSLPELSDLAAPELQLDLLPAEPTAEQERSLERLGYRRTAEPRQWSHAGGWVLLLTDLNSLDALNGRALTDWLRDHPAARAAYRTTAQTQGQTAAAAHGLPAALQAAYARQGFAPVEAVAALFLDLPAPWMVVSGWALELFAGGRNRLHHDLNVSLPLEAQPLVYQRLKQEWRLDACVGGAYRPWQGERFNGFQVHARRDGWPMLDLMFGGLEARRWTYRRDPSLSLPLPQARHFTAQGWPYLAPEAALLFKAGRSGQRPRHKDEQDFVQILPRLGPEPRSWLAATLRRTHPAHPWLTRLQD